MNEKTLTDCTIAMAQGPIFKSQPSAKQCKLEFLEKQILKTKILWKGHNETYVAPENFV